MLAILMFFAASVGTGLASLQLSQSQDVWTSANSLQAYYLAEAGLQDGIAHWCTDPLPPYSTHHQRTLSTLEGKPFGSYDFRTWNNTTLISVGTLAGSAANCTLQGTVAFGAITRWVQLAQATP